MTDLNTRKARFSLAHITAVATYADCQVLEPKVDRGSVDGILLGPTGWRDLIRFQAKSTARDIAVAGYVRFPLDAGDYENIRNADAPFILIVVLLPDDESRWLAQTDDETCLRYCGYWISLEGWPSRSNTATVTVPIPMSNIFNSDQLSALMAKALAGEML